MKWFFTLVLTLAGSANSHSHSRHLYEVGGCGAPQLTEEEKASVEAQLAARPSQQFRNSSSAMMEISLPITIPVYFHVLQKDATVGSLDDATVQDIRDPKSCRFLTKPLGWVLHARHARRVTGHYK